MEPKDRKILRLLEKNAKFTAEEIADIVGESAEYVSKSPCPRIYML